MSRLLVLSLATLSVVGTGCQKARMGSTPPKPLAQVSPQPVGLRQAPPMPPRWGELEPRDPMSPVDPGAPVGPGAPGGPVIVGPPPTPPARELPPSAPGNPTPIVIPVDPTPPSPPSPPATDVVSSDRRDYVSPVQLEPPPTQNVPPTPTRTEDPVVRQTQIPSQAEGPLAAAPVPRAEPISPPARHEVPAGPFNPQAFNQLRPYRDVRSAQPMATQFVETPPAAITVAGKANPTAPTQIVKAPKPECIGPEGQECTPPKSVRDQCDTLPLESKETKGKLDILIVADTSLSLRGGMKREGGELAQIARELENFVRELPDQDIQIAVMPAHGPASRWHARLFDAGKGDQTVLKIPVTKTPEERSRYIQNAAASLTQKMIHLPNESGGAQGEALLLSVYDAITDKAKLSQIMRNEHFFRSDAALNVVFITDEQDVCYDYKKESQKTGVNIEPTKKIIKVVTRDKKGRVTGQKEKHGVDPFEADFFEKVCSKAVKTNAGKSSRPLVVGDVHQALLGLMGKRRLILSGIGYKTENIPVAVEDENEMARGIIDLVEHLGGGKVADLAAVNRNSPDGSFAPLLKFLGESANSQIRYGNLWNCTSKMHPDAINSSSVEVSILGRNAERLASFYGNKNEVELLKAKGGSGNKLYSQFRVDHRLLDKTLKGKNTEGAVVVIEFMSYTGKDWKTGESRRR
jgi:hypothetical protein